MVLPAHGVLGTGESSLPYLVSLVQVRCSLLYLVSLVQASCLFLLPYLVVLHTGVLPIIIPMVRSIVSELLVTILHVLGAGE